MPLEPHQKSILLIMRARLLGNLAVASFAFGVVPILGWGRVMEHQIVIGLDVPLSFHPAATRVLGLVTPRSVG